MTIASIAFGSLYRLHLAVASSVPKSAGEWDVRAADGNFKSGRSAYAEQFISRMDLSGTSTLLDVGCGPGTIVCPWPNGCPV